MIPTAGHRWPLTSLASHPSCAERDCRCPGPQVLTLGSGQPCWLTLAAFTPQAGGRGDGLMSVMERVSSHCAFLVITGFFVSGQSLLWGKSPSQKVAHKEGLARV